MEAPVWISLSSSRRGSFDERTASPSSPRYQVAPIDKDITESHPPAHLPSASSLHSLNQFLHSELLIEWNRM